MPRWHIVTPSFPVPEYCGGYQVAAYDECEVIEVEAETKRDAIILGVKAMSEDSAYSYCREQRECGLSPYQGVWASDSEAPEPAGEEKE